MSKNAVLFSICLVLFLPIFPFWPSAAAAEYDYNSNEFKEVISQLDMQGHANDDLAGCPVKQLYYEEVLEMLNDGMTGEEIIAYYVDQYGQAALKEPGLDAGGILAWVLPAAGLLAGGAVIWLWLKKRKGKTKAAIVQEVKWESETEKEIAFKIFDEERRKHF